MGDLQYWRRLGVVLLLVALSSGGCWIAAGCGGFTAPTDAAKSTPGVTVNVALSNIIDLPVTSSAENTKAAVTINRTNCATGFGACFTPTLYVMGIRHVGLIRCTVSGGTDSFCPGETGQDVDAVLANGMSKTVLDLSTTVNDYIVYQSSASLSTPLVGSTGTITTSLITTSGLYSGLQIGLDFVIAEYPIDNAAVGIGATSSAAADGLYLLWCLNANGCSALSGYDASYDGLTKGTTRSGDIVFYNATLNTWYFWDTGARVFSALANGRPGNVLAVTAPTLNAGAKGELLYDASFGSQDALNISSTEIVANASDTLTAVFDVLLVMGFNDSDTDGIIDLSEMTGLSIAAFSLDDFRLAKGSFATAVSPAF